MKQGPRGPKQMARPVPPCQQSMPMKLGLLGRQREVPHRRVTCHVKPCWWRQCTRPFHHLCSDVGQVQDLVPESVQSGRCKDSVRFGIFLSHASRPSALPAVPTIRISRQLHKFLGRTSRRRAAMYTGLRCGRAELEKFDLTSLESAPMYKVCTVLKLDSLELGKLSHGSSKFKTACNRASSWR